MLKKLLTLLIVLVFGITIYGSEIKQKTYANGNKYVGKYKDNKRNGQGTYTYANGDKYVGEFKDDVFNGQGTYTYANGDKNIGKFRDGEYLDE